MRILTLGLALIVATGCSKDSKYEAACEHLIGLAKADIESNLEKINDPEISAKLRAQANATHKSDLETCVKVSKQKGVNTSCILDAKTIDAATSCLAR